MGFQVMPPTEGKKRKPAFQGPLRQDPGPTRPVQVWFCCVLHFPLLLVEVELVGAPPRLVEGEGQQQLLLGTCLKLSLSTCRALEEEPCGAFQCTSFRRV